MYNQLSRAKRIFNKAIPKIAIVGSRKMFCDIRHFSDIFEVELATHFVDPVEELQGTAQRKIDEVLIERLLHELYPIIKSSPTGRQTSLLSLHYNEREDGLPPPEPSLFD